MKSYCAPDCKVRQHSQQAAQAGATCLLQSSENLQQISAALTIKTYIFTTSLYIFTVDRKCCNIRLENMLTCSQWLRYVSDDWLSVHHFLGVWYDMPVQQIYIVWCYGQQCSIQKCLPFCCKSKPPCAADEHLCTGNMLSALPSGLWLVPNNGLHVKFQNCEHCNISLAI